MRGSASRKKPFLESLGDRSKAMQRNPIFVSRLLENDLLWQRAVERLGAHGGNMGSCGKVAIEMRPYNASPADIRRNMG